MGGVRWIGLWSLVEWAGRTDVGLKLIAQGEETIG